ncbi:hypothetical protein DFH09DRAFT_1325084 [Mycena vulgaris]|nr:hypothetical protein DFH09DRAFT_1325084 [Mycena vulgaris]
MSIPRISFHGDLNFTSARRGIQNDEKMVQYRMALGTAADVGFRMPPDLVIELAIGILTDSHSDSLAGSLKPTDKSALGTQYLAAFDAALRRLIPQSRPGERVYPARVDDDPRFVVQLGLRPIGVSNKCLDITHRPGAYKVIKEYARSVLLETPSVNDVEGLDRLRAALKMLVPVVPSDRITVHHYDKTYPTAVWDAENKLVALAMPKACTIHPEDSVCAGSGNLSKMPMDYMVPEIPTSELFWAFCSCIERDSAGRAVHSASSVNTSNVSADEPAVPAMHNGNVTMAAVETQAPSEDILQFPESEPTIK